MDDIEAMTDKQIREMDEALPELINEWKNKKDFLFHPGDQQAYSLLRALLSLRKRLNKETGI